MRGCGQYYAMHGGGLRQHWAMGGINDACAAAAEGARSPYVTDEEALVAGGSREWNNSELTSPETHLEGARVRPSALTWEPAPRTAAGAGAVRVGPGRGEGGASPAKSRATRVCARRRRVT